MDSTNSFNRKNKNSSEMDLQGKIIESLTSKYESKELLGKTIEYLKENINPGVCLICIEDVEKNEAIWSCENCYCILHLVCIQRWARDSIANLKEVQSERGFNIPIFYCCPKCRTEYKEHEFPNDYKCFCSKLKNPPFDPWNTPHSCGETCGKALKPECGHFCNLLCHSGPCPPCAKQTTITCYCKKSSPRTLRCYQKFWSCNKICGKIQCNNDHTCKLICHESVSKNEEDCGPCLENILVKCSCSKPEDIKISCSQLRTTKEITCNKICNKKLNCFKHYCQLHCHEGDCGNCELSCPCGKKKSICTGVNVKIATCEGTCSKILDCNTHYCSEKCHLGNCGFCIQLVNKQCKCGSYEKEVLCSKEFICTNKCKRLRDCNVHSCNKKCCDGRCPPCQNVCGKLLACKNHRCQMNCHKKNPCFPCPVSAIVKCKCGLTTRNVPCGSEKKTKPPECYEPCMKNSKCDHPKIQKHRCHFSDCPRCTLKCDKKLNTCSHFCPATCHSSKLHKKKDCPKCVKMIKTICPLHSDVEVECYKITNSEKFICEEICGLNLGCNEHKCSKRCHEMVQKSCGTCTEPCNKKRPILCNHECSLGCHEGDCQKCTLIAKIPCHCGSETLFVECYTQENLNENQKSCKNQCPKMLSCKHRCLNICHGGECSETERCRRRVRVTCKCKYYKGEIDCYLVESKVLECGPNTCNPSSRTPKESNSTAKRKNRKKKVSESEKDFEREAASTEPNAEIINEDKNENSTLIFNKVYMFLAVVAVSAITSFYYFGN